MRGDVDAWAGLDPLMASAEVEEGAKLFFRNPAANSWGVLNTSETFAAEHPDIVKRVLAAYEKAREWSLANPDELKATLVAASKLPEPSSPSSSSEPTSPTRRSATRRRRRSSPPASPCRRPA